MTNQFMNVVKLHQLRWPRHVLRMPNDRLHQLRWPEHVLRMPNDRLPRRAMFCCGKSIDDNKRISEFENTDKSGCVNLYLRDIGPQIGWRTVFLLEYTGPLIIYAIVWLLRQPSLKNNMLPPMSSDFYLRRVALACWSGHYIKRLLETVFVHRFSHATMPLRNLFVNCSYYFGFALFISYFTNHHLYTPPTKLIFLKYVLS
ncbi:unnamed protein product [Schistosoma mattheei]|uniref:Uncharacterized protein n=1 Tax=Schistosoma mattheei TaxID=31246 RepID=A0A183Q5N0_9TREM|nr:unnamed protein product [Schistosoma mattheei]